MYLRSEPCQDSRSSIDHDLAISEYVHTFYDARVSNSATIPIVWPTPLPYEPLWRTSQSPLRRYVFAPHQPLHANHVIAFLLLNQPQKYTTQSTGLWETFRKLLSVEPARSNGVPIKTYRNPPPGGVDPLTYDDPVTLPASDIADNPYWRRDVRRSYPKLSTVTQGDAVGLLTVGSAAEPSPKLLAGEEGTKQLVAVKDEGAKGLSAFFGGGGAGKAVLGADGMPPMPVSFRTKDEVKYGLADQKDAYDDKYPCRSFK